MKISLSSVASSLGDFGVDVQSRPELGQLSTHLTVGVAVEGAAEGFIQNAQVPDLHRSAELVVLMTHTHRVPARLRPEI